MFSGRSGFGRVASRGVAVVSCTALVSGLVSVCTPQLAAHATATAVHVPIPPVVSPASTRSVSKPTGGAGSSPPAVGAPLHPTPVMTGPPSVGEGFVAGKSVENTGERTANSKIFSNPDGSHVAELSLAPLHFRDPSTGAWTDVDSSVVADSARPGWYRSKANSWTARFGPTPQVELDSPSGGVQTMTPVGGAAVGPVIGTDPDWLSTTTFGRM